MYPTKVSIANNKGFESITAISRAFEVGTPAEDVVLSKYTLVPDDKRAFLIIPLAAGTIKVHLIGETGPDTYTISETEVSAYMGAAMPYLVDKVFKDGTTAQINIGL
jgi:hypothetical protein